MSKQLRLMPLPTVQCDPEPGRNEPRLWVRRVVIWSEPGSIVREIALRPGLNIVWSPDPSDVDPSGLGASLGHGSGKTLFCRLLRYCLGEQRFAPENQRELIATAFKDGLVGAEVLVDGQVFAVVRHIGYRGRHIAVEGGDLDAIALSDAPTTGMAPLIDAINDRLLGRGVADRIGGDEEGRAWLTALGWLTRDQECRLHHLLDWRDVSSGSDSPVRSRSRGEILDALRALIGALSPEEHELRAQISATERARAAADQELAHRDWDLRRLRSALQHAVGIDAPVVSSVLGDETLRREVRVRLDAARAVQDADEDPDVLWRSARAAECSAADVRGELVSLRLQVPILEKLIAMIRAEIPGLSFQEHSAANPVCEVCEVPISQVLVEGCRLSEKMPDLERIRARIEDRKQTLENEIEARRVLLGQIAALQPLSEQAQAAADRATIRADSAAARRAAPLRAQELTRVLGGELRRFEEALVAEATARQRVEGLDAALEGQRACVATLRDAQGAVFARLSAFMDMIFRETVDIDAHAGVTLTGNGLEPWVRLGGVRSTAAIDSLKVLAFDLAAMCLSIEGKTCIPAFLLHDSPREADLGLSAYHKLFRLIASFEKIGGQPLFQYIITTTTRPPDELCVEPWLRVRLGGSPPEARLLGVNL